MADRLRTELKRRFAGARLGRAGDLITIEVEGDPEAARAIVVQAEPEATTELGGDHRLRVTVAHGDRVLPALLRDLDAGGIAVTSVGFARPSLDDVFLSLTGRSLRDDA